MYTSKLNKNTSSNGLVMEAAAAIPIKVQFRHMGESRRVVWLVNQMMERFTKYPIPGASASIMVDETHRKAKNGVFQVKMKLKVPGEKLYVAQSAEQTGMHDGVYSAIAVVFDNIEHQLVKRHDKRSRRRAQRNYEDAA